MVHGDRRPYLVALIVPRDEIIERADGDAALRAAVDAAVDRVNRTLPPIERIRKYAVLREGFAIANGLMTPTMKITRHAIRATHGDKIDSLYV
jgi:long-chain acyl-CoA synthetase